VALFSIEKEITKYFSKNGIGGTGIWTRGFPHAKRTLYHWVMPPSYKVWFVQYLSQEGWSVSYSLSTQVNWDGNTRRFITILDTKASLLEDNY
jgi:hypothetical protein